MRLQILRYPGRSVHLVKEPLSFSRVVHDVVKRVIHIGTGKRRMLNEINHIPMEECGSGFFLLDKSVAAIGRHWRNFTRRLSQKVNSGRVLSRGAALAGASRTLRSRPVASHIKVSVYRSCIYRTSSSAFTGKSISIQNLRPSAQSHSISFNQLYPKR